MNVSILGGSGFVGGELIRLLLQHSSVTIKQVTSERYFGKPVSSVHPNLRKQTDLKFTGIENLEKTDLLFTALPHKSLMKKLDHFTKISERIIDLSADFRLINNADYVEWYGEEHSAPELMNKFVYGIVELHRDEMKQSNYISSAGCNATASILSLYPLVKEEIIDLSIPVTIDAKCGSSEGGNKVSEASHHPVRSGSVRSYKPTRHRHTAEMKQELGIDVNFSATSIEMVRGILVTCNVMLKNNFEEKDIWKIYRKYYKDEPFIRIVKEKTGNYRYPEPKILSGTNFFDVGFELDGNRLVVIGAIDNLMKGAAGQAVHAMNVMCGFNETDGLTFPGLHPV